MWLDMQDSPQKLPVLDGTHFVADDVDDKNDDMKRRRPTVAELVAEIAGYLQSQRKITESSDFKGWTIVISGEGEPTLRLSTLIQLVQRLKELLYNTSPATPSCIRITTNGLLDTDKMQQLLLPICTDSSSSSSNPRIAFSVALMTNDADQYDEFMHPLLGDNDNNGGGGARPHDIVQSFIRAAVNAGVQIEVTAVDRPQVDKEKTEQLAVSLGVKDPIRWRRYFP